MTSPSPPLTPSPHGSTGTMRTAQASRRDRLTYQPLQTEEEEAEETESRSEDVTGEMNVSDEMDGEMDDSNICASCSLRYYVLSLLVFV